MRTGTGVKGGASISALNLQRSLFEPREAAPALDPAEYAGMTVPREEISGPALSPELAARLHDFAARIHSEVREIFLWLMPPGREQLRLEVADGLCTLGKREFGGRTLPAVEFAADFLERVQKIDGMIDRGMAGRHQSKRLLGLLSSYLAELLEAKSFMDLADKPELRDRIGYLRKQLTRPNPPQYVTRFYAHPAVQECLPAIAGGAAALTYLLLPAVSDNPRGSQLLEAELQAAGLLPPFRKDSFYADAPARRASRRHE